jgi:hypothetical protein
MINPFKRIRDFIRRFDSVNRYSDGTWIFNQYDNPFDGSFFPDGRYVFHFPADQILDIERTLALRVRTGEIRAFKYAITPLPDEKYPAVVVYATKKTRQSVKAVLEDIGISDVEWKDGNPLTAECYCRETRDLPSVA